ncbi:hypothetical protein CBR_g30478 [Chara braunii]|uniref:Retrotransposon gag domain-containing protein n=1 Tax=Chara braunii TaxID=69332 RepID=A0A388LCR8_CHABU|nr:hypothetical protein CBR_g30478 [Chara braunii]|eukprot:GBG80111.1 hypothetical protein CBR_g30478 [Chara braunii]
MSANVQIPTPQQNANLPNQPAPRARAPMSPPDLYLFDPAHHLAGAWLATLRAQQYDGHEAQINIPARMGGDAHHWYSTYVWVDLPTFERDFMNRFDYVHPEQALYMIKDRVQKPLESVAEYRDRFYRMFVKTERGTLRMISWDKPAERESSTDDAESSDEDDPEVSKLLADDLPLDILSHSDKQPGTHVLSRMLEPHLVWSTCTEIDEDNCLYASQALYLEIDVTNLTFWDSIARQNVAQDEEIRRADEEEEEEELSSEERDDPDYVPDKEAGTVDESNQPRAEDEGPEPEEDEGSGLSGSECEGFEAEVRDAARKRARERRKWKHQETAEGKRPAIDVPSVDPSIGEPWRDPELPEEEDDGTTAEGSRSRRRRRSESPAPSGSPS